MNSIGKAAATLFATAVLATGIAPAAQAADFTGTHSSSAVMTTFAGAKHSDITAATSRVCPHQPQYRCWSSRGLGRPRRGYHPHPGYHQPSGHRGPSGRYYH
ncbi:MAG TPA: hypothetical protein VGL04_02805 [Sporichthyaceae bacterium]|jgi:hypothetical protein